MFRPLVRFCPLVFFLMSGPLAALSSCGPPVPAPAAGGDDTGDAGDAALLETVERRVAKSIARARESAVALEYAVADAPSGARRVATGVVVNARGDVLSVRIDPPPSDAPVVARDASGRRHPAQWVAADAETGLTLLQIDPKVAEPVRPASRLPRLGSQVLIIGNPFGLGHSVSRGQVAGLDRRLEIGPRPLGGLIQIDAALHPGDSGAPVTNLRGEWLGLVRGGLTAPEARHTPDHDLGFAIPGATRSGSPTSSVPGTGSIARTWVSGSTSVARASHQGRSSTASSPTPPPPARACGRATASSRSTAMRSMRPAT